MRRAKKAKTPTVPPTQASPHGLEARVTMKSMLLASYVNFDLIPR